jgi:hypothetical protein
MNKNYTRRDRIRVHVEMEARGIMLHAGRVLEATDGMVAPPSLAKINHPGREEAWRRIIWPRRP